jgi:hypothetical protein
MQAVYTLHGLRKKWLVKCSMIVTPFDFTKYNTNVQDIPQFQELAILKENKIYGLE